MSSPDPSPPVTAPNRAGYLMLLGSVILLGAGFHLVKAGLAGCPPSTAVFIVPLSATLSVIVGGAVARALGITAGGFHRARPLGAITRTIRDWRLLLPATGAGLVGGWLVTVTNDIYGPSIVAFLNNGTIVFLVISGMLLGDSVSRREMALIVLVIAGAFMFAYTGQTLAWTALGLMGLACVGTSIKHVLLKRVADGGDLWEMMASQQFLMACWAAALSPLTGGLVMPDLRSLAFLVITGFAQSFIGMGLLYAGYREVGIARGAPIYAMRPLVVLVIGLGIGAALPGPVQLVGGAMVLAGSAILAGTRKGST